MLTAPPIINDDTNRLTAGDLLVGLGWTFFIFGFCIREFRLWNIEGVSIAPTTSYAIMYAILFFILGLIVNGFRLSSLIPKPITGGIILSAFFLSDWFNHLYVLFHGETLRGEIILGGILTWLLIRRDSTHLLSLVLFFAIFLSFFAFFSESNGRILYSDDHSVFFYRLWLLKERFPFIPFYNPLWNTGIDSRDFFASGVINLYIIFYPLIKLFSLSNIYNIIVTSLLFIITPLSTYYACRLIKLDRTESRFASLLALGSSLFWFRWALKYGTLGFITSTSLSPLVLALWIRALNKQNELTKIEAFFIVIFTTLMLLWSPSGLFFVPLTFWGIKNFIPLWNKKYFKSVILFLLVINALWISIFFNVSKVGNFVKVEKSGTHQTETSFRHKSDILNPKVILKIFSDTGMGVSPLIIAFSAVGIFLLPGNTALIFGSIILWLFALGTAGVPLKPQLELDRMLVVAFHLLSIPAGLGLWRFLKSISSASSFSNKLIASTVGGFILATPFINGVVLSNRSIEQYAFANENVDQLANALRLDKTDGRTVFTGFVLHDLSQGHLAPLALKTNKPLVASTYVHNLWRYQQIIPKEFLEKGDIGIKDYFDLINATTVIAHEKYWRDYFISRPKEYELIASVQPFMIFKRLGLSNPTYFLEGAGVIKDQNTHTVTFELKSSSAILKFNYFPFLKIDGCKVAPYQASTSVTFIKVTDCPTDKLLTIEARGAAWRVKNG